MKYYPRLQLFKNSTGVNIFDGTKATSYGHCVGHVHQGYGVKVQRGECHIFVVYRKHIQDGVCFEVSYNGRVLQVQGLHRRNATVEETLVIHNFIETTLTKKVA